MHVWEALCGASADAASRSVQGAKGSAREVQGAELAHMTWNLLQTETLLQKGQRA